MSRNPKDWPTKAQHNLSSFGVGRLSALRQSASDMGSTVRRLFTTEDERELAYIGADLFEWKRYLRGEITGDQYKAHVIERGRSVKANVDKLQKETR